jgi:hypothetical protein
MDWRELESIEPKNETGLTVRRELGECRKVQAA